MTNHSSADVVTPLDWVDAAALDHGDEPALVFADGAVSYRQLLDAVASRRSSLPADHTDGSVVEVAVRADLASIVDLLAIQASGGCPLPYLDRPFGVDGRPADGAVLCVATSGSSGGPKVVPLSMGNLAASVEASRDRLGTTEEDRWLVPLPLHHIGGLSALYRVFEAGAIAVVAGFDDRLPRLMERTSPSIASMVPTMVRRMLDRDPGPLASVGHILIGGGPATAGLMAEAGAASVRLLPTYGMTEASSQVATVAPGDRPVGVGKPLDGFEVAVDGDGRITVDGPAVFDGYLGEPRRNAPLVTADLGEIDLDGNLLVHGRVDEVAVSGGENVFLPVVEEAIRGHDGVLDVTVVAVDDPEWGQAVCAAVVGADPGAVADQLRDVLGRHEIPRRWVRLDAIPVLANGKPDRPAIRGLFTAR